MKRHYIIIHSVLKTKDISFYKLHEVSGHCFSTLLIIYGASGWVSLGLFLPCLILLCILVWGLYSVRHTQNSHHFIFQLGLGHLYNSWSQFVAQIILSSAPVETWTASLCLALLPINRASCLIQAENACILWPFSFPFHSRAICAYRETKEDQEATRTI